MTGIELDTAALEVLRDIGNAASVDEARPVLTGVNLRTKGGELIAEATDSYQLVQRPVAAANIDVAMILPAKALADAAKALLRGSRGHVTATLTFTETGATLANGSGSFSLPAVDGEYPHIDQLIREPNSEGVPADINFDAGYLTKIVKAFGLKFTGKYTHAELRWNIVDGLKPIRIEPMNPEVKGVALLMPIKSRS